MAEYRGSKEYRKTLRQEILRQRRVITDETALEAGKKIAEVLKGHPFFFSRKIVGSYISTRGEISTEPVNEFLLDNHELLLPFMDVHIRGHMDFYSFRRNDPLIENRFHILEPENKAENLVIPDAIEAMIVPTVGFDLKGNRMGMGGGYYDRILKKVSSQCLLIGIAYDFQRMEQVPIEHWDMPLDEVITPTHHYVFNRKVV